MRNISIHVRGVMGSGKSTFSRLLAEKLNLPFNEEPLDRYSLIEKAYREPERYRFEAQKEIFGHLVPHVQKPGVVDMTLEDVVFVFSQYYLNENDFFYMKSLYVNMMRDIRKPDFTIYIKPKPETVFARIQKRRRPMECTVTLQDILEMSELLDQDFKESYPDGSYLVIENTADQISDLDKAMTFIHALA